MGDTPQKDYSTVEQLRKKALQSDGYISAIKAENNTISTSLGVVIQEVGKARENCEEAKDVRILKVVIQEVEKIGRASQGISLLLEEWQRKLIN